MFSGRKTKEFYIDLQDNRYYTPGEIVRGEVVLDLAKPTKINHIRVTLSGVVQVGASSLTLFNRECQIATAPDDSGRAHQLEAKSNRFPFELSIPGASAELPTSMKLGDGSGVRYTLSAVLKVPFSVIQTWSPQDSREISIVEQIDVSLPEYCARPRVDEQVRFQENTAVVSMKIPKVAIVRGDILPVTAIIKHYKAFQKPKCVKISLIRWFHQFGKGKSQPGLEKVVKSRVYDLELTSENEHSAEIVAKIFIPQSVPPTTLQSGRILRVKYAAHIEVDLNTVDRDDPRYVDSHLVKMDIPILIGTIPKAEVSIEDDEEEEESELSATVANLSLDDSEEPSSPFAPSSPVKSVPSSSPSETSAPSSPLRSLKSVPSSPTSDTHKSVPSSPTELPAPLSRDNSISSHGAPSRRPTYESYPSRSSSQRSSSYIPQQRGMDHESVHSHASTPSTSPYLTPSTSTASRSNSQRMAMPVVMPTPPQRHIEEFHYPRQQSPAMPMPMPHVPTGPPPPPHGPYSTSPHSYYRPPPSTQFPHDVSSPPPPPPPPCDNNFMAMPTPQMPWSPPPPYPYSAPDASSTPPPRYWS